MFPKRVTVRRYRDEGVLLVNPSNLRRPEIHSYGRRMRKIARFAALGVAAGLLLGVPPTAQATELPVPPEVTSALATFGQDPQGATTAWSGWAASSPMTYVRKGKRPKTRSNCRIDASGIADCNDFAQVIGRGNRNMGMKKISEIITAGKQQYFRDPPLKRWTKTRTASNPNPITGVEDRIGFDPWLPWSDGAPGIATQVLPNGSLEINAQNPGPAEDEPARTIVRIAANGLQATLLEYDAQNRLSNRTAITFEPVASVKVPRAR